MAICLCHVETIDMIDLSSIFGIILGKRGSVYSGKSASYEVKNLGSLGDLGA